MKMNIGDAFRLIHKRATEVEYRGGIMLTSRLGDATTFGVVERVFVPSDWLSCREAAGWCYLMHRIGGTVMNANSLRQIIEAINHARPYPVQR